MKEKIFDIPVVYQMAGVMKVKASSLGEAKIKAKKDEPLPKNSFYLDDSCEIDEERLKEMYEK